MPSSNQSSNQLSISDILEKIDIESFASQHLPPPDKKEGKNWLYNCAICGAEKKLSFFPGVNRNIPGPWKCNKCDESGNLFSFLTKFLNMSKKDAVQLLKRAAGIPNDPPPRRSRPRGGDGNRNNKGGVDRGNADSKDEDKKGHGGRGGHAGQGRGPLPVAPPSSQKIYQRFVELTHLTDEHWDATKKKRGFSDSTIDALKLRSGGDYVAGVLEQLKAEFPPDELVLSGVMVRQNNALIPCEQLLQDRVLIPYVDESGAVYHLRPHKLGFKGVAPQPFCRQLLRDKPEVVVFTEGEFKAAALSIEWGIPAISVPGISSFAGKYFERLTGLLTEFGARQVIVIFDNEEKGDPGLPGFKERIEDRFDTPFWAYILGYKLGRDGFHATVCNLPDEWRDNGKIDFDSALAQGRTREEIEKVIQGAMPPKEFLDSLSEDAKRIVKRKAARFFKKFNIRREYNKYIAIRFKGDETYEEVISNFVINIKSNYLTGEGVIRNIEMVNEFGEVSETFTIEPGDMAGGDSFKKFCFSKGNYIFKGKGDDLINIWDFEFNRDTGTIIHIPEKIGRIKPNLWLFGNMAIRDGKVYRPGEDGVIWIDGEGYKPQSLHIGPKDEPIEDAIPSLYEGGINMQDVAKKLRHCVGGYEAHVGIGWVVMTIFSKDIFAKYKCLPFLFPHGKRESGKSSFMRWIIRFFGIENDGISLPETSQNYIMRVLGYFSSLGVWFDEYRNEKNVIKKDGYLRSAYNRQISGKGIKSAYGARGYEVNGTISISGEEVPKDSGLFTRSCFIQLSSNKRDRMYYDELNVECEKFSGFVYHLIMNYDHYRDKILNNIAGLKKALVKLKISDRTAENWAILAACFESTVGEDDNFIMWVKQICTDLKMTGEDDHALNEFMDDINHMISSRELNTAGFLDYREKDMELYIYFKGVYAAWAMYYRKKTGKEPFDRTSIAKYLADEPYFKEAKTVKMDGISRHCYILDLKTAPDNLKEIGEIMLLGKDEH